MWAQEVVFITHVPEPKMGIENRIQVQYEIKNEQNISDFRLSTSNDFEVVGGPYSSEQFSMMNGEANISVNVTYEFQPKRLGKLKFPTALARVRGKTIRSNVASIEVVKGDLVKQRQRQQRQQPSWIGQDPYEEFMAMQRQMVERQRAYQEAIRRRQQQLQQQLQNNNRQQPNQTTQPSAPVADGRNLPITKKNLNKNLFIRVVTDKNEVHEGEQITATYKLYSRVESSLKLTKLPDLNNFWTQDFDLPPNPKPVRETYNSTEYLVWTLRKSALFPLISGRLVLDTAVVEGVAHIPKFTKVKRKSPFAELFEDDPFFGALLNDPMLDDSYFANVYEIEEVPVRISSPPVFINVTETPTEDKPEAFKGAVGNFSIESKISAAEMTTDDVATLTLTIRGSGNIKLIDPPKLLLPNTVEVFDPIESDTVTSKKNNKITGYKTITYRFNPQATGNLTVPSLSLAFYNADAERYEVTKTPEYLIRVKPGNAPKGKHILPMDIHDIAAEQTELSKEKQTTLPEQAWYWGAYLLPTIAFMVLLGFRRKEEQERSDVVRFKNKRANKVALSRLEQAEKHRKANEHTKFYEETSKAVWLYLSDKLNISLATLSKEMAGTLLRKRDISQDLIDELFLVTDECELALYAPEAGDFKMNQIYADSIKIIGTLEDKLG